MFSNVQTTYTDYKKIHDLVIKYNDGDKEVSADIINQFGGFIYAYINLIKKGEFDINNYSVRQFIKIFVTNPQAKKYINQYQYKPFIKYEIDKSVKLIVGMFSIYDEVDIQNDLTINLLTMCKRYKDTSPTFHIYVQKFFHFCLLDYYKPLIKNSSVNNPYNYITLKELDNLEEGKYTMDIIIDRIIDTEDKQNYLKDFSQMIKISDDSSPYSMKHLNTNWIMGVTCSDLFKNLSILEREILVNSYIYKVTDKDMASKYGVCRATINRKKIAAKEKLLNLLNMS